MLHAGMNIRAIEDGSLASPLDQTQLPKPMCITNITKKPTLDPAPANSFESSPVSGFPLSLTILTSRRTFARCPNSPCTSWRMARRCRATRCRLRMCPSRSKSALGVSRCGCRSGLGLGGTVTRQISVTLSLLHITLEGSSWRFVSRFGSIFWGVVRV